MAESTAPAGEPDVVPLTVRPLDPSTWDGFATLVEGNNGVWGGCWCMGFHPEGLNREPARHRAEKRARVESGGAHAALVYAGDACVGWCQFGPPAELPRIKHRRTYEQRDDGPAAPDWRVTCFFVDKATRRRGVSAAALDGAIHLISGLGGGVVESFPEAVDGRRVSSSFLHNGTLALFESRGFERVRPLGKNHWLVRLTVPGEGPGR